MGSFTSVGKVQTNQKGWSDQNCMRMLQNVLKREEN